MTENKTSELLLATESRNLERVEELLTNGVNPNAMGVNTGALHAASYIGNKEIVEVLLKHGANPNVEDEQNFYPLHLAASRGHTAVCNLLIKNNASLEVKTNTGGTALHIAAASSFAQTVTALVKAGCDKEAEDYDGNTPLSTASALGCWGAAKSLLKGGAKINALNKEGNTPLMQALWMLCDARIDEWSYEEEETGTRYEIKKGCFRRINDYKKDPKQLGTILSLKDQRDSALESWGPEDHLKYLDIFIVIKELVKAGADVNKKNKKGISPLRLACYSGVGAIIELLYKKNATFDPNPWQELSQLHQVAGSGRLDGLEMFFKLASSKDVNAVDAYGWTPAHYLADTGGAEKMADLLIENGADTSIRSTVETQGFPIGVTAEQVALHWNDIDLAKKLKC